MTLWRAGAMLWLRRQGLAPVLVGLTLSVVLVQTFSGAVPRVQRAPLPVERRRDSGALHSARSLRGFCCVRRATWSG